MRARVYVCERDNKVYQHMFILDCVGDGCVCMCVCV